MHPNVKFTNSARYKCLEYLKKGSVDLYLSYCGSEICNPGHAYGPEVRTEYLLHIVVSGHGIYKTGNKVYTIGPNMAFLIYPDVSTYYEASSEDPWTYVWVGFNGMKAELFLKYANFTSENPVISIMDASSFVFCVEKILEASKPSFRNDLTREGYLYLFLSELIQDQQNQQMDGKSYDYSYQVYVDHTLEFIEHNYHRAIKVQSIADYIGINRSYLTNCFKNVLNISPQEYILSYRMYQASILLKSTDLPVNEIANRVGYDDSLNFSKTFKKFFDINPTNYRNSNTTLDLSNTK